MQSRPRLQLRHRSSAKSSKLQPHKNLHGGLRGATRGWHLRHLRKINCTLQNARVEKAAWWAAMCSAPHPQPRKINCTLQNAPVEKKKLRGGLRCDTRHSIPLRYSASAAPQNQLQFAECSRPKSCMVGCGVVSGVGA